MLYGRIKYQKGDVMVEEVYHAGNKRIIYHYEDRVKVNNKAEKVAEIIRFFNHDYDNSQIEIDLGKGGQEFLVLKWTEVVQDFE